MLRQSVRLLLKSPAATLAAVASLALGIGANTTIFSLIDAVVLRPLPLVWRSDRLVSITDAHGYTVSNPTFRDFASGSHTLERLAAFAPRPVSLTAGGLSTVDSVEVVSGNYFRTLGVSAEIGRPILEADDQAGGDALVLSSAFWRQQFAAEPNVVGRRVSINGAPFTVVGIAAEGFRGVRLGARPAGWITINAWPRVATGNFRGLDINARSWGWLQMVGRLRDGVTPDQTGSELNQLAKTQEHLYPSQMPAGFQVRLSPLRVAASGLRSRAELTRFVVLLLVLVLAVLGIACANVSGLLLARALARRRELAIRMALGASRRRVALELMLEGVLLGAIAAVAAVLIAMWTIDLLQHVSLPGNVDMSGIDVHVSTLTIVATGVLTMIATLLFGIGPAIHGTRTGVVSALKEHPLAGRGSRQYIRGGLVSVQITLSLVLLVGALLFARTLQSTLASDLGFKPDQVAYAVTNVALERYTPGRAAEFYGQVLDRVRANPAVAAAGWTRLIPGSGEDSETVDIAGYTPPDGRHPVVSVNLVSSGYFEAMGIPIVSGRAFTDADASGNTPVVVVSQAAASTFWHGAAIGRRFSIQNTEVTIIGVAGDVPPEPGAPAPPSVYGNALQPRLEGSLGPLFLVARTPENPAAIIPVLTEAIRAVGPTVPLLLARTMNDQLLEMLGVQRSAAVLLGLLSVVALVLSAGGVYAMVAFWVTERTREFGVRMALGATSGMIRQFALRHVGAAVLVGIVVGVPLALALGRASRSLLYQLSPADPVALGAGILLLLATALAAGLIPAQRAARTDLLKALRAGTE